MLKMEGMWPEKEITLARIRCKCAVYTLNCRNLDETMEARGVSDDHPYSLAT